MCSWVFQGTCCNDKLKGCDSFYRIYPFPNKSPPDKIIKTSNYLLQVHESLNKWVALVGSWFFRQVSLFTLRTIYSVHKVFCCQRWYSLSIVYSPTYLFTERDCTTIFIVQMHHSVAALSLNCENGSFFDFTGRGKDWGRKYEFSSTESSRRDLWSVVRTSHISS